LLQEGPSRQWKIYKFLSPRDIWGNQFPEIAEVSFSDGEQIIKCPTFLPHGGLPNTFASPSSSGHSPHGKTTTSDGRRSSHSDQKIVYNHKFASRSRLQSIVSLSSFPSPARKHSSQKKTKRTSSIVGLSQQFKADLCHSCQGEYALIKWHKSSITVFRA